MSHILNIEARPMFDNSITGLEYHTYAPYATTSFGNSDEIRIPIQQQDLYTLPCQSFLYIEGTLLDKTANDEGAFLPRADAKLINNAVAFLFDEIRYELNGVEIDRNKNVGITSTLKNLLSLTPGSKGLALNAGWNITGTTTINSLGHFNFAVPLSMLLGFAEDYRKIIANVRQELILIRSRADTDAICEATDNSKLTISKIQLRMPHVKVEDVRKMELLHLLASSEMIQVGFRSWELHEYPVLPQTASHTWSVKTSSQLEKPRFIVLAFQTGKKNVLKEDASRFDHTKLRNLKVYLNSEQTPYDNLELDFPGERYATLYDMYARFQPSYYGGIRRAEPLLTPEDFATHGAVVVIDASRQVDYLKSGPVDVRVEWQTAANVPAATTAYCLYLHDRVVEYNILSGIVRLLV